MNSQVKTFAEFEVGDSAAFEEVISADLVKKFAELSGDTNPLHIDESYASQTDFRRPIAHGMIAGALFSRLMGMYLPGQHALYVKQTLNFRQPIYPGATVKVAGQVTHKTDSASLLTIKTEILDSQSGQLYVDGEALVKVLK
jgi:acyl dehydratase